MEQHKEVVIAKREDGRRLCISVPFGKAQEGDMIMTTGGTIAQVERVVEDFSGGVQAVASVFTTVYSAQTIWGRYWSREEKGEQDAEKLG